MKLTKKRYTNLCKKTNLCRNNLNIPRIKMPQFDKNTTKQFINFLRRSNIKVNKIYIDVQKLKPTQNQLNLEKIQSMKVDIENIPKKTILTSKNNYIIDGHHRWGTIISCCNNIIDCGKKNKINKISTYKIDLLPRKIVQLSNIFDVKYNDINKF